MYQTGHTELCSESQCKCKRCRVKAYLCPLCLGLKQVCFDAVQHSADLLR